MDKEIKSILYTNRAGVRLLEEGLMPKMKHKPTRFFRYSIIIREAEPEKITSDTTEDCHD